MPRALPRFIAMTAGIAALAVLLTGCGGQPQGADVDPAQVDSTELPLVNACRKITPGDLANPSNASKLVDCEDPHTAETYHVQTLPAKFDETAYDAEELGTFATQTCASAYTSFLSTDESTSMRTVIGWVWFRPSKAAWDDGARWFRCDVVGGSDLSPQLINLPTTTEGLLARGPLDEWMACVDAPSVSDSPRIPCSQPHLWRAVTTIKLGAADSEYPGDKDVLERTKEFCSASVSAWLGYPADFDFGYTWFGAAAWEAGNRRSVCWARTNR